jgi:hypothetical protein
MKRTIVRRDRAAVFALLSLLILAPWPGHGQVPTTIGYQGSLTDASGAPVTDTLAMVFALYDAPAAVTPLWSETQTVTIVNGIFSVLLGSTTPFPPNLFTGPRYLGVKVDTDAEMTPRLPFAAAPFALALDQDLDGWTISDGDCDDAKAAVNPGAAEVCDGLDNDCDGTVDDGADASCDVGETCTAGSCQPIDFSGTWSLTPTIAYQCAFVVSSFLVDFSFASVVISDTNPSLSVDTGDDPGILVGSFTSGTDFSVSNVLTGDCDETYGLTGSFTDANTFTGSFTATYTGNCLDCTNQNWSVTGTRP